MVVTGLSAILFGLLCLVVGVLAGVDFSLNGLMVAHVGLLKTLQILQGGWERQRSGPT
jgi:hypothetical protein